MVPAVCHRAVTHPFLEAILTDISKSNAGELETACFFVGRTSACFSAYRIAICARDYNLFRNDCCFSFEPVTQFRNTISLLALQVLALNYITQAYRYL